MTRTERQQEAIRKWIKAKGKGSLEFPTAFGKTFTAITAMKAVLKKYPNLRILVVVPTTTLKDQWINELNNHNLIFNIEVYVINTIIKHTWTCDMLVIDEIHVAGADQMSLVFTKVTYKLILGLTATFERLDGKHKLLEKYCPIVDVVTTMEAINNGWISMYKEYQVLLDVDDIEQYKEWDRQLFPHLEFFNYNGGIAYECLGKEGWKRALRYRDEIYKGNDPEKKKQILSAIMMHARQFQALVNKRKSFIHNHPEKIRIAQKIMQARPNAKIITFNYSQACADLLENGKNVYTGKTSKTKARVMIEDFLTGKIKHLHSIKKLIEG